MASDASFSLLTSTLIPHGTRNKYSEGDAMPSIDVKSWFSRELSIRIVRGIVVESGILLP